MSTRTDLLVETCGGVLQVTLNRPQKRNALSRGMLAELREVFETAAADQTLLVAVLQGAGEACFAAGGDLRDLSTVRTQEDTVVMADAGRAALEAVRRFPVPVVAALNGDALGGGAELALACDFRVMATHARLGFIHGHLNITTAWGGSVDLMRLLGPTTALRLLARNELIDADTALAIGLADSVARSADTLANTVQQFIEPIGRQVPRVARAYKAIAVAVRQGESRERLAALETRMFVETWVHDNHWAAADKILQKGGQS